MIFSLSRADNTGFNLLLAGYLAWVPQADREHLWHYVPATTFAVLARILTPKDKAQLAAGTPVEFRAEIAPAFGAPPYQYLWYSDRDGVLGQASTLRKSLTPGRHVITLWVSDRNGTADAHAVIIQVGSDTGATAAASWALGLSSGLFVLGVLLCVSGRRRMGIALAVSGLLALGLFSSTLEPSPSIRAAQEANSHVLRVVQQQQPLQAGKYFWPDQAGKGKLRLEVAFDVQGEKDNGLVLRNVIWKEEHAQLQT